MRALDVGSGNGTPWHLGAVERIRLDVDPDASPDICMDAMDISPEKIGTFDIVNCSHMLEHLYEAEVIPFLKRVRSVLNDSGACVITVPNLISVFEAAVCEGKHLTDTLYTVPMGDIRLIDVIYGNRVKVDVGKTAWDHKTGFDRKLLKEVLLEAGFPHLFIRERHIELVAVAYTATIPSEVKELYKIVGV